MVERSHPRGFTLIEVIIATGLLVAIALGSAQLFALAIRQSLSAKQQLVMSVLAARKIDELAAAVASGPISPSPADSLDRAVDGFADVADEAGARYLRRWQVTPLAAFDGVAIAIAVRISAPAVGTADVQVITICRAPVS